MSDNPYESPKEPRRPEPTAKAGIIRDLLLNPWHPLTLAGVLIGIILGILVWLVAGIIHGL